MKRMGIVFMLFAFTVAGCAGGKGDASNHSATGLQTANEPPAELLLKDKIKNYSTHIGKDSADIEKVFNEKLGANPSVTFNEAWFAFFTTTDPNFAGIDSFLPQLWGQLFIVTSLRSSSRTRVLEEAGDGDAEGADREAERAAQFKKTVTGFNSFLLLLQGRFVQDAAFFDLKTEIVSPDSFPLPEKYFGSGEGLDSEVKAAFGKFLYSASLKVNGDYFSFFKFFEGSEHRSLGDFQLGKFTFLPAKDNVLVPERSREPGILQERSKGGSDIELLTEPLKPAPAE